MALKKEYNGDITQVEGYYLAVARNQESGDFIGFYALTPEATYLRANATWITATGQALARIHGAQLVEMKRSFIQAFDKLDATGEIPDEERIKKGSTTGRPGSWDQQK